VDEAEEEALSEVNRKIFQKFSKAKVLWDKAIHLTALVDGLLSLYLYSMDLGDDSCFPVFESAAQQPHLKVSLANICHIFFIRIMNIFYLLFEYWNIYFT
jgi:hypothetical protein